MSNGKVEELKYENRNLPWYKHGWVWFVIFFPSLVVVASFVTLYIAIVNAPESVVEEGTKRTEYKEKRKEGVQILEENTKALNISSKGKNA